MYQDNPSVSRLALSPGRSANVATPSISSEPAASTVRSPPPLLRTPMKKLLPAVAALGRLSTPAPVPFQTKALARSVRSTVRGPELNVVTGRDCDRVLLVTVMP